MASEIIPRHCEMGLGSWLNPHHRRNLTPKERNVQSHFFNRKASSQTSKRPQFLRLDSTGEAGDSSPEVEEDLSGPYQDRSGNGSRPFQADCSQQEQRKRFNRKFTQDFHLKTKKTSKRSSQYLQSNHPSSEIQGTEFLEQLASKFNSCGGNTAVSNNISPEMSGFCGRQGMAFHLPMPNNMNPLNRGNPSLNQDQKPNMAHYNPFINMPFMFQGSAVFPTQSAPGWNQPMPGMRHPYMPRVPPPLPPQLNQQPWLNGGYPFQGAPRIPLNQTHFNFCLQRAQFTPFSPQQQTPNNDFSRKSTANHPSKKSFHNRHSGREKKHAKMFTKILQRPPPSQEEAKSKDCSPARNLPEMELPQNNNVKRTKADKESHTQVFRNDVSQKSDENVPSTNFVTSTQYSSESESSKTNKSVHADEKELGRNSMPSSEENNCTVSRNRHSSIDFLLSGLNLRSLDRMSDSDFADCDWDTLDESINTNDAWDEHFVSDDPYNPLTGWRCQKKVAVKSEHEVERPGWARCSQEFDSGTESGSEDESDSDSDDWDTGQNVPLSKRAISGVTFEKEPERALARIENTEKGNDLSCHTPTKAKSEEKLPDQGNDTTTLPEGNPAKRKKALHPSISYILGENGSSSDDFSDDESDDWDSFDDSDDDFAPSLLRREDLNLFQFSNNHFSPLTSFLHCNQGIRPELKNSPSVPCGPIFKPKARTMLISQRIICQVSDSPVFMVVPLENSGKMSQNSVPAVQCTVVPSREQSFPNSCLRQMPPTTEKTSPKKVHFNNKATLIICPEPSHLVDEIKSTRRGPWLDYARDRCRFQHRIQHLEKVIGPCLKEEHRNKIAKSRQLNDNSESTQ